MPLIDYRSLREMIPIEDALDAIGWRPTSSWGTRHTYRGPCPIHGSDSPKSRVFQVQPYLGLFRCWKCGAAGDVVALWGQLHSLDPYPAALALCREFGVQPPLLNPSLFRGQR